MRARSRIAAVVAIAVVVLTGCIGAISRDEFDQLVRDRGGGVSAASLDVVLDDLRVRLGDDDPSIRFGRIDFSSTTAVFEVRNPQRPDELDTYVYLNEELLSTEPVRLDSNDDLDADTAPLSTFTLDVETLTERALAEFASIDGYVTGVTFLVFIGPPTIQVDVESPRSSGTAVFDADGELLEFRR